MEKYKLDNSFDADKIFLVNRSELEGRFDVDYYNPEVIKKIGKILGNKHSKLSFYIESLSTGFNNNQNNSEGVKFYRTQNIRSVYLDNNNVSYTLDKRVRIPKTGSLLFTRIGVNVGDVAFNDLGDFAISDNIISAEFKDYNFSKFIAIYLVTNLGKVFIEREKRDTARAIISYQNIKNILVPIIPKEIQQQIVDFYQETYRQKQQKEAEAQALLESIDTYLLNELGITQPEKDNSLQNRIFTTRFSEVSGGRFDVFAIINKNYKIEGGKFENKKLKKIASLIKGQSITSDEVIDGDYPVIAGGQTSPYNHHIYNFEGNIITVSASGAYSGFVWYHSVPIFASDCTVIQSKDEEILVTIFLAEILKLKQQEIYNLQQGAGQPHVYAKDLEKLSIPIPPIEKQNEIVNYIQEIRSQAKQLQEEAKNMLDQAKQEVEKMILGE